MRTNVRITGLLRASENWLFALGAQKFIGGCFCRYLQDSFLLQVPAVQLDGQKVGIVQTSDFHREIGRNRACLWAAEERAWQLQKNYSKNGKMRKTMKKAADWDIVMPAKAAMSSLEKLFKERKYDEKSSNRAADWDTIMRWPCLERHKTNLEDLKTHERRQLDNDKSREQQFQGKAYAAEREYVAVLEPYQEKRRLKQRFEDAERQVIETLEQRLKQRLEDMMPYIRKYYWDESAEKKMKMLGELLQETAAWFQRQNEVFEIVEKSTKLGT